MTINSQSFTQVITSFATVVQGAASVFTSFVIGSILRAIGEGTAWISLWLQGLILTALALSRAVTSNGADLDSWLAQFGFARLPPTAASGAVTFSRFTPTSQAVVPIGVFVQTTDGLQQYAVTIDTANPAYSVPLGGYVLAAGVASITVPVVSVTPGPNSLSLPDSTGNVVAGAIDALYQPISGVDTVSNALPFQNGVDAESDNSARIRFVSYLATLAKATLRAIGAAITALGASFTFTIGENVTYGGVVQMGYFYVVVDDGTGAPTSQTISTVYNAVDAVRPFTSTFGVFAPVEQFAVVSMVIGTTSTGADHSSTCAQVQLAITAYINSLTLGQRLSYFKLGQIALETSADVTDIVSIALNGGTADMVVTNKQVIKTVSVSVI